MFATIIRS